MGFAVVNSEQNGAPALPRPATRGNAGLGKGHYGGLPVTPPGEPHPVLHYNFCKTCGVRAFARGEMKEMGGAFYALAVTSLDDLDPDELAAAPINYVDGRHDQFDKPPTDTRLM